MSPLKGFGTLTASRLAQMGQLQQEWAHRGGGPEEEEGPGPECGEVCALCRSCLLVHNRAQGAGSAGG
jgi:hypothetical protein